MAFHLLAHETILEVTNVLMDIIIFGFGNIMRDLCNKGTSGPVKWPYVPYTKGVIRSHGLKASFDLVQT